MNYCLSALKDKPKKISKFKRLRKLERNGVIFDENERSVDGQLTKLRKQLTVESLHLASTGLVGSFPARVLDLDALFQEVPVVTAELITATHRFVSTHQRVYEVTADQVAYWLGEHFGEPVAHEMM